VGAFARAADATRLFGDAILFTLPACQALLGALDLGVLAFAARLLALVVAGQQL
jgi:hypothetical protein